VVIAQPGQDQPNDHEPGETPDAPASEHDFAIATIIEALRLNLFGFRQKRG
jgi:hypothetical protein